MEKAILITTEKRGVFMAYADDSKFNDAINGGQLECKNLRMCVYWSSNVKGVIGLAVVGPDKESRITKAAPKAFINGITSICELTDAAIKAWESEPWG